MGARFWSLPEPGANFGEGQPWIFEDPGYSVICKYIYRTEAYKSVGFFGVLGSAVSDPLSEPLLRRFGDAPRSYFLEKTRGCCKVSLLVWGLVFSHFGA